MFKRFVHAIFRTPSRTLPPTKQSLNLEELEGRCVPAGGKYWWAPSAASTNNNWSSERNWDFDAPRLGRVPLATVPGVSTPGGR